MANPSPVVAVTIARQMGAGGAIVGRRLAERLGFTFLDNNMLRLAAEKCGASEHDLARWDEHRAHFWERLGDVFTLGAPEGMWSTLSPGLGIRDRELFDLQQKVIRGIAVRESCVVIGRGGVLGPARSSGAPQRLPPRPAQRPACPALIESLAVDEQNARKLIARIDADRATFLREVTGIPMAPESHHLSIDTGCVSLETAEKMILLAIEQRQ